MAIRCFSYSISILNKKAKLLNEKLFSFIIIYSAFWDYFASIPCWFIICCICLLPSGILLPRFHAPCFVNAFYILKLCCLDSMLLVLLTLFSFCISHPGIMLPRFHAPRLFTLLPRFQVHCLHFLFSVFAFYILHSVFWNDVASIL